MTNKKKIFILFSIVALLLFGYILLVKQKNNLYTYNDESVSRKSSIPLIIKYKSQFLSLADDISKYIDTSFYAEYITKSNRFTFYYYRNDSISNFFTLPSTLEDTIFSIAKDLGVLSINKFNSENFYRFELKINDKVSPRVLVLKNGNNFLFKEGTQIYNSDTLSNILDLDSSDSKNVIFKVDSVLWVYFPVE